MVAEIPISGRLEWISGANWDKRIALRRRPNNVFGIGRAAADGVTE
jgi:hypothetical protein